VGGLSVPEVRVELPIVRVPLGGRKRSSIVGREKGTVFLYNLERPLRSIKGPIKKKGREGDSTILESRGTDGLEPFGEGGP